MPTTIATPEQANSLAQQLVLAQEVYHSGQTPLMNDADYDALYRALAEYEVENGRIKTNWKSVGAPVHSEYGQIQHLRPMLSLATRVDTSIEPVKDFVAKVYKASSGDPVSFMVEPKWDGIALSLYYFNNRLQTIATRGDGIVGEDVSRLATGGVSIPGILTSISRVDPLEVRGELMVPKFNLEAINGIRRTLGSEEFKNCRNAAAGIVRMKDSSAFSKYLEFKVYDLFGDVAEFTSQHHKQKEAAVLGFKYTNFEVVQTTQETAAAKLYAVYENHVATRGDFYYDVDGVVYKVSDAPLQKKLPGTSNEPGWAIAHKFTPESAVTTLEDIRVGVGRTGRCTPVAILKPVEVAGVTITNASLKNEDEIRRMDVRIGELVMVHRAGDVIPEITGAVVTEPGRRPPAYVFPIHCPECGGFLTRGEEEAIHYCNNTKHCPAQMLAMWEYVFSRKILNIQGLGEATIKLLVDAGALKDLSDIWKLTEAKLKASGVGEADSKKIAQEVHKARKTDLWRVYACFGIRGCGRTISKDLAKAYPSFPQLLTATKTALLEIDGVGEVIADNILAYLNSEEGSQEIANLNDLGLDFAVQASDTNPFVWLGTAVVTGSFDDLTREDVKDIVEKTMMYKVVSKVKKGVTALLVGKNPAKAKVEAAKALGLDIITDVHLAKF